mmetsp:Transcript_24839/g.69922  ORF Transcript_24839/g.69922 Transcript_24839/m.69922 type:complete len:283 (+) Transcript_24839:1082-1930(+)
MRGRRLERGLAALVAAVRVGVAAELPDELSYVTGRSVVHERAARLQQLFEVFVDNGPRRADSLHPAHLRQRRESPRGRLRRSRPEHEVASHEGRLPFVVLRIEVEVVGRLVHQHPDTPLVAREDRGMQDRLVFAGRVARVRVGAVEQERVEDVGVPGPRGLVQERRGVVTPQQPLQRRSAVVARARAPEVLPAELQRAHDALEVALGHGRAQLADDLEVAVARSHLRTVHRARAELELAHVPLEAHHELDVPVPARQGALVAVIELLDVRPEACDDVFQAAI